MELSRKRQELVGWALLAAAMVAAVVLIFWLQRDLAYADDGFNWLVLSGLGDTKVLVEPYGGHLIFVPLLIFKLILEAVGTSYTAFGVVQVAMLLGLSAALYEYGRRRVGPLLALPAAIIILFLGSSWNVIMQPTLGIQFISALLPGLLAILALERDDRRGDIAACALLVVASWGFEMGLAFLVGAAVSILLREDRWKRVWIVAVPLVIYGIWRLWSSKYGSSGLELSNLPWLPAYAIDSLGVIAVSLFGLYYWVGHGQLTYLHLAEFDLSHFSEGVVILILAAVAIFFAVRRLLRRGPLPATFWVAVAVLVTLWLEQGLALASNRTPGETRYILPDAVAFLMVAVEMARGVKTTRITLLVAALLTLAMVVGNLARFHEGRDVLEAYSPPANAAMTVMVLGGDDISPDFNPAIDSPEAFPEERLAYLGAGPTQALSEKYGQMGFSVSELEAQPDWVRRSADIVAAFALEVHTQPATPAQAAGCKLQPGAGTTVTVPPGGAVLVAARRSPLLAHRWADEPVVEVGEVGPEQAQALVVPSDEASRPWQLSAAESGGLTACPL